MSTINLVKGGRVSLTKEDGTTYSEVRFGANWGAIEKVRTVTKNVPVEGSGFFAKLFGTSKTVEKVVSETIGHEAVDLDLSAIVLDASREKITTVYFGNRTAFSGAIKHSGDDLVGDTDGDDDEDNETIVVKLNKLPENAAHVFFVLNSFRHHKFDEIPHMGCRIYAGNQTLASFNIANDSGFQGKEAMVIGRFYRRNDQWKFKAEGLINNDGSIGALERTVKTLI